MPVNKDGRLYRAAQSWKWRVARALFGGIGTYGAQMSIPWAERTWEYPWVLRRLPAGTRNLLDFGPGPDSPLPLWLTCQGIRVTTADFRRPSFAVPGVDVRIGDFATLPLPARSFDAVTCISVFEHLAVSSYGQAADDERPEVLLRRMGSLTVQGGCILLSLPIGRSAVSANREDAYRVYAPGELRDLVHRAGLRVAAEDYVRIGRSGLWEPVGADEVAALDSAVSINALAGFVLAV